MKLPLPPDRPIGSGRLNLVLKGFSADEGVPADQVVRMLSALPPFHLESLREIIYCSPMPMLYPSLGEPPPSRGCGQYVQEERTVYLYPMKPPATLVHVLYHEIAHHVFFLVLASTVKKRWVTEIHPGSACATDYAATNAQEDFAESYSLYAQKALSQAQFARKHAFMRDCVFSGAAGTLKERAGTA